MTIERKRWWWWRRVSAPNRTSPNERCRWCLFAEHKYRQISPFSFDMELFFSYRHRLVSIHACSFCDCDVSRLLRLAATPSTPNATFNTWNVYYFIGDTPCTLAHSVCMRKSLNWYFLLLFLLVLNFWSESRQRVCVNVGLVSVRASFVLSRLLPCSFDKLTF